jgi:hypothetical protein
MTNTDLQQPKDISNKEDYQLYLAEMKNEISHYYIPVEKENEETGEIEWQLN